MKNRGTVSIFLFSIILLGCSTPPQSPGPKEGTWWSVSGRDLKAIDTARDAPGLSAAEKDFILGMNMARTDPKRYAEEIVAPLLSCFDGKIMRPPNDPSGETTKEGVAPVKELIDYLRMTKPVSPLTPSVGLSLAAHDHALDQGKTGDIGHTGGDGSLPAARMRRYGLYFSEVAECNAYGDADGGRAALALLIDDGVIDRGHRLGVMDEKFSKVGVAVGPHPHYGWMAVADFAVDYLERDAEGHIGLPLSIDRWGDVTALDTARSETGLSSIEKDLVLWINAVRARPDIYADMVFARVANYTVGGLVWFENGIGTPISTDEAKAARDALRSWQPAAPLHVSPDLCRAAEAELADLQSRQPFDASQPITINEKGLQLIAGNTELQKRLGKVDLQTIDDIDQGAAFSLIYHIMWETRADRRATSPKYRLIGLARGKYALKYKPEVYAPGTRAIDEVVIYLAEGQQD